MNFFDGLILGFVVTGLIIMWPTRSKGVEGYSEKK